MNEDERNQEALFRHAILGELLSRNLRRGELRPMLERLAEETYRDHHGQSRRAARKTRWRSGCINTATAVLRRSSRSRVRTAV